MKFTTVRNLSIAVISIGLIVCSLFFIYQAHIIPNFGNSVCSTDSIRSQFNPPSCETDLSGLQFLLIGAPLVILGTVGLSISFMAHFINERSGKQGKISFVWLATLVIIAVSLTIVILNY